MCDGETGKWGSSGGGGVEKGKIFRLHCWWAVGRKRGNTTLNMKKRILAGVLKRTISNLGSKVTETLLEHKLNCFLLWQLPPKTMHMQEEGVDNRERASTNCETAEQGKKSKADESMYYPVSLEKKEKSSQQGKSKKELPTDSWCWNRADNPSRNLVEAKQLSKELFSRVAPGLQARSCNFIPYSAIHTPLFSEHNQGHHSSKMWTLSPRLHALLSASTQFPYATHTFTVESEDLKSSNNKKCTIIH